MSAVFKCDDVSIGRVAYFEYTLQLISVFSFLTEKGYLLNSFPSSKRTTILFVSNLVEN